ncbi:hypothetical protein N0V93_001421 [Gnomoniopsis smithogilvyi]|uniref:Uncharacterized protein n=1 Tax=Gnomoniopsis smithogilvyi TaxID=1191159 RepID=A0A9W8Z5V3_9PEZI|nr:hypothetical protein N0V93_001421 [Gnomoniopsis smithogilvyi]
MSHEEPHVARRSASQGSLGGTHANSTRAILDISTTAHHPVPYFKPLRSIREHGHTFLDPAASADGMLRKTTETGDIGLFSIKTGRPTALRPRASLGDLRQPHRQFSRSSDRPPGHDDRKRLPSYRDSTSEIISMYGSDNQSSSKSASGTLSPPWDDYGQRSYSMTTCGSKSYTLPRSNDLRLALDCHPGAQRPRSPFPYPTRLPRPGIRPSSPALTENGVIDYSKMVEIERIPQRTCHHPHKTLFPFKTTRDQPGPLSLRYGMNQSIGLLPDNHDAGRPFPTPMPRRPPLPWGLSLRDRLGSTSSEQSLRTLSLSSTSGGYNGAPQQVRRLQAIEKKPPIFYDYSEDFEDAVDPPPDFPIANPKPTRVSKSYCPIITDAECDAESESADEEVGHIVEYLRRVTMIDSAGVQDGGDTGASLERDQALSQLNQEKSNAQIPSFNSIPKPMTPSPFLPQSDYALESSDLSTATLEDHEDAVEQSQRIGLDHVAESINNGLLSEASTVESPLDPETPSFGIRTFLPKAGCYDDEHHSCPDLQKNLDVTHGRRLLDGILEQRMDLTELTEPVVLRPELTSSASAVLPERHRSGRRDSQFYSLSSGLSDLASFVKYVDKHMQAIDPDNAEPHGTPVSGSILESDSNHVRYCKPTVQETNAPPRTSSLAHRRRSYVGCKVNTPLPIDELERYQVVSTRSGPTLVPQPISPARMLRVKNSIPKLMKALPPLPGYSPASESPFNPTIVPVEFEPFEFSRLTDARSTLIEPFGSESHGRQTPESYDPFSFDRGVRKRRLKLKQATPLQPEKTRRLRPVNCAHADVTPLLTSERKSATTGGEYSTAPVKRRLPNKASRPTLGQMASEDSGTVKRRPGFDKSSAVSDLASSEPLDLFSTSRILELAVPRARHCPSNSLCSSYKKHGPVLRVNAPPATDEGRGVSLDTHLNALNSPRVTTEVAAEDEMQSFFSDSLIRPHQGLRRKLSNLKSRLIDSRHQQFSRLINNVVPEDTFNMAKPSIEAGAPNSMTPNGRDENMEFGFENPALSDPNMILYNVIIIAIATCLPLVFSGSGLDHEETQLLDELTSYNAPEEIISDVLQYTRCVKDKMDQHYSEDLIAEECNINQVTSARERWSSEIRYVDPIPPLDPDARISPA